MVNASDPKSIHSGALPEARPLDIATLGKARGLLDNASSATAHGDHKDAIGYVRQALDLLGAEAVRVGAVGSVSVTRQATTADIAAGQAGTQLPIVRGSRGFGSSSDAMADPLVAAKERLAQWLVAEPGRTWEHGTDDGEKTPLSTYVAHLYHVTSEGPDLEESGTGPDLASAPVPPRAIGPISPSRRRAGRPSLHSTNRIRWFRA